MRPTEVFRRISPQAIHVTVQPARIVTGDDWRHVGVQILAVVLNRGGKLLRRQARIASADI